MRQRILTLLDQYAYDETTVSDTLDRLDNSSESLLIKRYQYLRNLVDQQHVSKKPVQMAATPSGQLKFLL
ncbi:hypothetical protein [Lysinibacillus alkalisoli]|nr:hypothetical protein [Lysinibacillus alkalisoli]